MNLFAPILNQMIFLFAFIVIGFVLARGNFIPENSAAVLSKLGEPNASNEIFDCGEGNSRMLYRYASFDLYTMKSGDAEVIDQIELKDDLSETDKGICLGSKESAVTAAYGKADRQANGSLTYVDGKQELTFDIENGQVVAIGLLRVTQ